jgi:hypothetical protein
VLARYLELAALASDFSKKARILDCDDGLARKGLNEGALLCRQAMSGSSPPSSPV